MQSEDSATLLGPFPLGDWSPDTRRICFRRADGQYRSSSEQIDTASPLATRLRESSRIVRLACGHVELEARGSYANAGAPVTYGLSMSCTQTAPLGQLSCSAAGSFRQSGIDWYRDTWRASFTAQPGPHLERCFGGIGNGCDGASNWAGNFVVGPARRNADGTFSLGVSVGSILHDNCCLAEPNGYRCGGDDGSNSCRAEWDKAVGNAVNRRSWQARFGPYRCVNTEDDLSIAAGRPAGLGGQVVTRKETAASRALSAPAGTAMDDTDAAFCASGRLARTGFGVTWSVCE